MLHPLVKQLYFARSEFMRCLEGLSDQDAVKRLMPMNCISWMVGHLASQEQYYFVFYSQGEVPHPQINKLVGYGHPATTPPLKDMLAAWKDITEMANPFLETLTAEDLEKNLEQKVEGLEDALFGMVSEQVLEELREQGSVRSGENLGTRILRTTCHYFFHTGEAHAIRQQLGHPDLPQFVGDMPDFLFLPD